MQIRRDQLEAIGADLSARHRARARDRVRLEFPEVCGRMSVEELTLAIDAAMEKAASYGITAETDADRYIDAAFAAGPGFDVSAEMPWAAAILTRSDLSPGVKVELLHLAIESVGRSRKA